MDFADLAGLAGAHAEARAIQTALKLGIFEQLASIALDAAALAGSIHTDTRATGLLANAMVAIGLLTAGESGYRLTDSARRYLLKSSPEYLGGMILFEEMVFPHWLHLEEAVRDGQPVRAPDMFQSRPEDTERFIRAMDSL